MKLYPDWPCDYPTPSLVVKPKKSKKKAKKISSAKLKKKISSLNKPTVPVFESEQILALDDLLNKITKAEILSSLDQYINSFLEPDSSNGKIYYTPDDLTPIQKLSLEIDLVTEEKKLQGIISFPHTESASTLMTLNEYNSLNINTESPQTLCDTLGISLKNVASIRSDTFVEPEEYIQKGWIEPMVIVTIEKEYLF